VKNKYKFRPLKERKKFLIRSLIELMRRHASKLKATLTQEKNQIEWKSEAMYFIIYEY